MPAASPRSLTLQCEENRFIKLPSTGEEGFADAAARDSHVRSFPSSLLASKSQRLLATGQTPFPSDIDQCTAFCFDDGNQFYDLLGSFVHERLLDSERTSFTAAPVKSRSKDPLDVVSISLGYGIFAFSHQGEVMLAIHQEVGNPVGTGCGVSTLKSLTLLAAGQNRETMLRQLCATVYASATKELATDSFKLLRWDTRRQYWRRECIVQARPLSSVIMNPEQKDKILNDLAEFLAADTKEFYSLHGIPYKRAYLLHGVPGAGKTSLIQAIAGHFKRQVCYLSPAHPDMTDDNLRAAFQSVPSKSVIVLEDIDSLFSETREGKVAASPLTFSGLLNAMDGIGAAEGQLIFLTTNCRDKLDAALIRNGRIDVHVHFPWATRHQMEEYWCQYYPSAPHDMAEQFGQQLQAQLGARNLPTAALQHFFVVHRKCNPAEALDALGDIVKEMDERASEDAKAAEQKRKMEAQAKEEANALEEGVKVEARYRGGSRHYKGKIIHKRLNGTFDILYDDGDKEMGVSSDLIKSTNDEVQEKKVEAEAGNIDDQALVAPAINNVTSLLCGAVMGIVLFKGLLRV